MLHRLGTKAVNTNRAGIAPTSSRTCSCVGAAGIVLGANTRHDLHQLQLVQLRLDPGDEVLVKLREDNNNNNNNRVSGKKKSREQKKT